MNRIVLGALIALALTGLGLFWWQGRAEVELSLIHISEPTRPY